MALPAGDAAAEWRRIESGNVAARGDCGALRAILARFERFDAPGAMTLALSDLAAVEFVPDSRRIAGATGRIGSATAAGMSSRRP